MADLGAVEEDVPFDDATADTLITRCRLAATAVESQAGPRASAVSTGCTDFVGHFAFVFATNAATAAGDASELVARLREVAAGAQSLKDEAAKEQQRRETARAWLQEQADRSLLERGMDELFGPDDPPVGPPAAEPSIAVSAASARARQSPPPGGGGGGGGTSSARPSKLRSFATSSGHLDEALASTPGRLRADYADFVAKCRWGSLDASGVFTGYTAWLAANAEDVAWARTVADAFTAAGGEGELSTMSNSAVAAALRAAGVDATRQDLVIEPPQAFGGPATSGYANDPVNASTGNFVEVETDLTFPGAAAGLVLGRCYNSFDTGGHAFGPGWSSVCDAGLTFDTDGLARLTLPDGRQVHFPRLGAGWDRAVGENLWLIADDSGELVASGNDGSWWRLSESGALRTFGTGPRESRAFVEVGRDDAGRVVRLTHARGQWIGLEWADDRVVVARSADGRVVSYGYDERGQLVSASGPAGTRSYGWNADGLIVSVTDADGVVEAENGYDDRRRVTSQRSLFGRTTRFVYLPGRVTVVSDEDGARSNTWISDDKGRLVGVVDADEQRQSSSYDRWGNPVLLTERDGAATVHQYDDRGRRIQTVTPSGADISYGFDGLDRVTTVVTEQGAVTTCTYEGEQRNPSTILDPEGGLTRLTWHDGLLSEVVDPTEVTLRFGYDDRGDLIGVTNADGQTARLERDVLGRVTAAVSPSGHRTEFVWDPASGQLAQRQDPDGAVWRYEHSVAGRLTATIDPFGARTCVEYGSHGEESRTVDPLEREVTRQLDELGNVSAVTLPDGSQWRFAHDDLSRLSATTDPTGGVWSQTYDAAGHLVATVDPTGVRVGVDADPTAHQVQVSGIDTTVTSGFDPLGRLTSAGRVDGTAAVFTYDRCGRPVEALDGDGGLTRIVRDPAGRPVAVTSPSGLTTTYGYDGCGRLATVTDPAGGTVTIGYDVDGQAVTQTLPTGEVARSRYDACGRLVEHTAPGAGTSSWTYDLAGRVVGWKSPQTGPATFSYDAAGQLLTATDGNGGVTRYTSDQLGRTVEIVNPMGGVTRRKFDGMNRCVAETDPLGRSTSAGYDAAGRLAWREAPDGRRTTLTYDAAGRPATMAVDGKTVTALTRDLRRRTVTITDTSDPGRAEPVEHVLEWNSRGQLIRRARGGRAVTWGYDADGRRTRMTTPDGTITDYRYDAGGRLREVDSSLLGRAAFDRDAAGRIISAVAGGLIQSWEHSDGFVVAHTITDGEGATRTAIDRDRDGRVLRVTKDDGGDSRGAGIGRSVTEYGYDRAGQLISARTEAGIGTATGRWVYDAAGRLSSETIDNQVEAASSPAGLQTIEHVYDLAGQLLSTVDASGTTTRYSYDAAGRRLWSRRSDGTAREFVWNPTGYLAGIIRHDRDDRVRKITVHADALGELASVDGTEFFWDTAGYAGAPVLAGDTPILTSGPVTGIGAGWTAPGWRTTRAVGADPWSLGGTGQTGLGAASVGSSGEVSVDGLEWMGARVYDPAARGFLSVDPLDPVTGAGWAGNPYAFAGNDPMHAVDPTGLRPVTDAELAAYRDSNNGLVGSALQATGDAFHSAMDATGHWLKNNWEYVAGGAMVVAGGALMATGVGGPAGMMLISAGADTIIQKATTGDVNWGQVAVSGAAGAVGFGAGSVLAKTALSTGAKEVAANVAEGAVSNGAAYLTGPGPHTVTGLAKNAGFGAATGGVPLRGAAGQGLESGAGRLLNRTEEAVTACFVAGTPVLLADGTTKPIEDIQIGDEVAAFNPETGENEPRRVLDAFTHHDIPTYRVILDNDQAVTTTAEHPFMVDGQGWTPVRELRKGDQLVRPDGSTVTIHTINATGDTATVHNFEVDGLHNYYVQAGNHWLLVHNSCGDHVVLGKSEGLAQQAKLIGGRHLMQDADWQSSVRAAINDPSTRISVVLDGVTGESPYHKVVSAVQRDATGRGSPFDWEMRQLHEAQELKNVNFWEGGSNVKNPFE
ncbi:DUF6531 domain-containing protein [uncultured Friedmanniella sp.]|uniref:DUF6531 domain-containing protein n=1 Tax=uncultured Friedmanniella sp. TaxID=335381 RepID=UPI0035CB9345